MKAFDLRTKTFSRMSSRGSRLGMRSMLSFLADAEFDRGGGRFLMIQGKF